MKRFLSMLLVFALATYVWAAAPANDNYADATAFTFTELSGDNTEATLEAGEVEKIGQEWVNSMWYTFTLDGKYKVTLDVKATEGSDLDTCLVIAQGATLADATIVYSNDTSVDEHYEGVLEAGTYQIGVYGWNSEAIGAFTLSGSTLVVKDWYCTPDGTGSGDSFEDPCSLKTAINSVATGNSVFMGPGNYDLDKEFNADNTAWGQPKENCLKVSSSGVNIIGAGSDQTILNCGTNSVGFEFAGFVGTAKGFSCVDADGFKYKNEWGGPYYGYGAPFMVYNCTDFYAEDIFAFAGYPGPIEDIPSGLDNGQLIRPARISVDPNGGTADIYDCAFISEGYLSSVKLTTLGSTDEGTTPSNIMNFSWCTFKSNKDKAESKSAFQDHKTALYGNDFYVNTYLTVNVENCVFLNTNVPVGQQAADEKIPFEFNVKNCFMPGANITGEWGHANVTYTNCDTVIDPQVDANYVSAACKAGWKKFPTIAPFQVVVDEDFSSCEEGDVIGKGLFTYGYGGASDGTAECVVDPVTGSKYIQMTKTSGLFGVHYNIQGAPATGWAGAGNKFRYLVYNAKMKISGDNPSLAFAYWDPGLQEINLQKDGDIYRVKGQNSFSSESELPFNEWFDLSLVFEATTTQVFKNDGVKNAHVLRMIGVNGVYEACECVPGQEGDKDTFNTLRYFFWSNGTVCLDSIKVTYYCDQPVNDYLARATDIAVAAPVDGTSIGSSIEHGENPGASKSVWYRFKAPADGWHTLNVRGAGDPAFDSIVSVYSSESATAGFGDLTPLVELQDTAVDEQYSFNAVKDTYYYIAINGFQNAEGDFTTEIVTPADTYVAPGATGTGASADDPMGDLTAAMDNAAPYSTVFLAPGTYSIADFNNQWDIWGPGMTALCFKAENVTLKGAGPAQTKILIPDGYVGIRMERKGAVVRDLTVWAETGKAYADHYRWHMQGAICMCNQPGQQIINVAIHSEAETDGVNVRPLSVYSVNKLNDSDPFVLDHVAVETPNCNYPVFVNQSCGTIDNMTVKCKSAADGSAFYFGQWPWGGDIEVTVKNTLVTDVKEPFHVEKNGYIDFVNLACYNTTEDGYVDADAEVTEDNTFDCAKDPGLRTVDGVILVPGTRSANGSGWQDPIIAAPANDNLADAIAATVGKTEGSTEASTAEAGENEAHHMTVWYTFTPAKDGVFCINDEGSYAVSGYDAQLSIYSCEGALEFGNLTTIVESQDTATDESFDLTATAGVTYVICWDGYTSESGTSNGEFTMDIYEKNTGDWYVAAGATGSGFSADDPTGDLATAMNQVLAGKTVNVAAGTYSIADFNNQWDIWGDGMTALVFKAENVTLKGAGPDKTKILVPDGYVGVRMERNGATLEDLTVWAEGGAPAVYRYSQHMQGAVCLCNCVGMTVRNVAVYSGAGTDAPYVRPFSIYSSDKEDTGAPAVLDHVAVYAPNCLYPVFINQSTVVANNLTVKCQLDQTKGSGVFIGQWPWGGDNAVSFSNLLIANVYEPMHLEKNAYVDVKKGIFYNTVEDSFVDGDAEYEETEVVCYEEGENDPNFSDEEGFILATHNNTYAGIGWKSFTTETPNAMLGYDLQGTGSYPAYGDSNCEIVWKNSEYFADKYICGDAIEYRGYVYLVNDPSPNATVVRINTADGTVEEWLTEPSWDNGAACITAEGFLYVADEKSNVCKFNVLTKELVWSTQLVSTGERLCSSGVKFFDNKVFVTVNEKGLYAVNNDGSLAWSYADAAASDCWSGNGVSFTTDGTKVLYKTKGYVKAVNVADGTLAWSAETDDDDEMVCRYPIVANDGTVLAQCKYGSDNGEVKAYNPSTGALLWTAEMGCKTGDDGGLALDPGSKVVYASGEEGVTAISVADGSVKWFCKVGHVRESVIPVLNGGLYAFVESASAPSEFYYLVDNGDSVTPTWSCAVGTATGVNNHTRPLLLEDGDLFVATPNDLVCLRPVPEPAIFGLLALVALFLRRK